MAKPVGLSVSAFAKLAGVSRQAIYDHLNHKRVVREADGSIDPKNQTNSAYLAGHMAGTARHGPRPNAPRSKKAPAGGSANKAGGKTGKIGREKSDSAGGKKKSKKSTRVDPRKTEEFGDGSQRENALEEALRKLRDRLDNVSGEYPDDVNELVAVVQQKGYWDTVKAREDAKAKQLAREKSVGSLVDLSVVVSMIGAYHQGLVANFVDSVQRQAMQICQMLGMEGKQRAVEEFLEKDNRRRLEESDRVVNRMRDQLKRGAGGKRGAA